MLRIPENTDWIIFTLLGVAFAYVLMFISLNRGIPVLRFLTQRLDDAANTVLNWLIISIIYITLFSILLSQYVPVVPHFISERQIAGYELNKFGFVFFTLVVFYLVRAAVSYIYFNSVGQSNRWRLFYFTAQKFYFVASIFIIALVLAHFFLEVDRNIALNYYAGALGFSLIFKLLIYSFAPQDVLPEQWYYKFLYICTLQILPFLVLWKFLFL